ncbi:hypothetical protein WOLCODRAFT_150623 [Wolfiporia cocos MD-104 SS10]|uniref:FACT complex subunit n=1 Tax=Wolfiporia cocos (strain MD-104) TaxID=742152 RepID=A0A2H3JL32_WOLCO|nr:hypothetical protein WOLCODRAFT_150623 [Wolfiporia cocos MD-104 SS10]
MVLPIHGFAVPFHINTIQNMSKNNEGEFTYLRVNFQTPGQFAGKEDTPFEDPDITDLKKEVNKHEQQKKEMVDVIEQDVLVEIKGRCLLKLHKVFSPMGSQNIDILFSNVKHLFFQPCDYKAWEMCDLQRWLSILNAVCAGDIDRVLEDLHTHYPSTAEAQEGFLLFQLCCHKFVKHVLAASAVLQHMKDAEKDVVLRAMSTETRADGAVLELDGEGAMDVDDPLPKALSLSVLGDVPTGTHVMLMCVYLLSLPAI